MTVAIHPLLAPLKAKADRYWQQQFEHECTMAYLDTKWPLRLRNTQRRRCPHVHPVSALQCAVRMQPAWVEGRPAWVCEVHPHRPLAIEIPKLLRWVKRERLTSEEASR